MLLIDEFFEFGELPGVELAPLDQVGREAMRGAFKDTFNQFADHAAGGNFLRDVGRPDGTAAGTRAFDEFLVEHDAEHRGDGGGGHVAFAAQLLAEGAERRGPGGPKDAQDFEFAVGGVGVRGAGHEGWSCRDCSG